MRQFGDLPEEYTRLEDALTVILPVPYDGTSTWIKGADKGPEALIEASCNMEIYDIETDSEVWETGIHTAEPVTEAGSPEAMSEEVYRRTLDYLDMGKLTVVIGGEHSVSIGTIRAHHERFKDLTVVQIDAHGDLRQEYEGSTHNHACVMARARELGPVVQVGIRSLCTEELPYVDRDRVFFAHQIRRDPDWMEKAIGLASANVYLTVDLDGFDPSVMPSTGTPEPGGLLWYEVNEFIGKLIKARNLVGFDINELCPNPGAKASDFLAAKLLFRILSMKFTQPDTP